MSIKIYFIDALDTNNKLYIKADNTIILTVDPADHTFTGNLCGGLGNDGFYVYEKVFDHSASTLTLLIISDIDTIDDSKAYGFREVSLTVSNCHPTCSTCTGGMFDQCTGCQSGFLLEK